MSRQLAPIRRVLRPGLSPAAGQLTQSGDLVDDAYRNGGQGDGATTPTGMTGIYGAYENLVTNGGFETNTAGWSASGSNTIATSTEQAKFGSQSAKCTFQDNAVLALYEITLTDADHTAGVWVYIPSDYDGGTIRSTFFNFTSGTIVGMNADTSLTDQWQEINPTCNPDAGDLAGQLAVSTNSDNPTAGKHIYIDGVQVVASSIPLPYPETDGSTTTTTAGRIQIPATGMSTTYGAVCIRGNMRLAANSGTQMLWEWGDDSNNRIQMYLDGSDDLNSNRTAAGSGGDGTATSFSFSAGDDITALLSWDSTTVRHYVNGGAASSRADTNFPSLTATTSDIGTSQIFANLELDQDVYWAAFYGPGGQGLGDAHSAYLNSLNNSASWEDMPLREHLVGFWNGTNATYQSFV